MRLWTLLSGLLQSKRAMDEETMRKRSRREGAPLNAHEFARLDAVIREGKRAAAIEAHRAAFARATELGLDVATIGAALAATPPA
jgi:hypothetical protein